MTTEEFDHLIDLAGKGELNPVIDRELPLGEAAEAHRLIEAREVFGKIVLRVSHGTGHSPALLGAARVAFWRKSAAPGSGWGGGAGAGARSL